MARLLAVSDGTGTTAERVLQAALTQFDSSKLTITRYGSVRTAEEIRSIAAEAAQLHAIVVHTLVSRELRDLMLNQGRALNVTTIDLMGPLLARLSDLLEAAPLAQPGLFQTFDTGYLRRIEAMDFTVRHDDGRNVKELDQAEIVLVGVSRTSKTPLSIYLAYRGWKVANVPIVLGQPLPESLSKVSSYRVVGLIAQPKRLSALRQDRIRYLGALPAGYADEDYVRRELAYAFEIFGKHRRWPIIDVTVKTIEESASEIVSLVDLPGESLPDA